MSERRDELQADRTQALPLLHGDQRNELQYRRSREFQVFAWSSSLLVAIAGAFLLARPTELFEPFVRSGSSGRLVATLLVLILCWFSARWQAIQRDYRRGHQRVLAQIAEELGAFSGHGGAEPLYPGKWRDWGSKPEALGHPLARPSKSMATVVLGIVAVIAIWAPLLPVP